MKNDELINKEPWLNQNKLQTLDELIEEHKELKKSEKYKDYERKYLGDFVINENTEPGFLNKELNTPIYPEVGIQVIDGSKFDREPLKKQLDYMANDVLLVNDLCHGGATMIKPYVAQRINVNPIDDASNIISLKEMLNKQFGKEGHIEK